MVETVRVRQVGSSISVTIPHGIAERFHLASGDKLHAIETEDGVLYTPYGPTSDRAWESYKRVAKRHQKVLRNLATGNDG